MEHAQSEAAFLEIVGEPFVLDDSVDQSESLPGVDFEQEMINENKFEETVGAIETDSSKPNLLDCDRINKRWFYEPRVRGPQPDLLAPAFLNASLSPPSV